MSDRFYHEQLKEANSATIRFMHDLLDYLATHPENGRFQKWHIERILGGRNNILYRVSRGGEDIAVKFLIVDERHRAQREYAALQAIAAAGLEIAPKPLLLDTQRYTQAVVVQTWLLGERLESPPTKEAAWQQLIDHYVAIHTITPARVDVPLVKAVINFNSIPSALAAIKKQETAVPPAHTPATLARLWERVAAYPTDCFAPHTAMALCRVDSNPLNILAHPHGWRSVDWENSGWGDPAFELADLMTHPGYATVPLTRWQWVIEQYALKCGDDSAPLRIRHYYPLMLVWWVARLARMLYETPLGLDERLAQRAPDWQAHLQRQYERYAALAEARLIVRNCKT